MNKTHFSDNFLWNCFFEVHDCSTNNHCRETFKSFVSKDLCIQRREFTKLLLQSDGFRLFGRETVKSGGKERENKRHLWSSVAQPPLTLLMESEQGKCPLLVAKRHLGSVRPSRRGRTGSLVLLFCCPELGGRWLFVWESS